MSPLWLWPASTTRQEIEGGFMVCTCMDTMLPQSRCLMSGNPQLYKRIYLIWLHRFSSRCLGINSVRYRLCRIYKYANGVPTHNVVLSYVQLWDLHSTAKLAEEGGEDGRFAVRSREESASEYVLSVNYKGRPTHHLCITGTDEWIRLGACQGSVGSSGFGRSGITR